jgi:hypothetical protein
MVQNLHLAFSLMMVGNESLDLEKWRDVWNILYMSTNSAWKILHSNS